jgi:hypothetical protein
MDRAEAGARSQGMEFRDRVFVWIYRLDALTRSKVEALSRDLHRLVGEAADVDFDPAFRRVVEGQMLEPADIEIAAELAIDPF